MTTALSSNSKVYHLFWNLFFSFFKSHLTPSRFLSLHHPWVGMYALSFLPNLTPSRFSIWWVTFNWIFDILVIIFWKSTFYLNLFSWLPLALLEQGNESVISSLFSLDRNSGSLLAFVPHPRQAVLLTTSGCGRSFASTRPSLITSWMRGVGMPDYCLPYYFHWHRAGNGEGNPLQPDENHDSLYSCLLWHLSNGEMRRDWMAFTSAEEWNSRPCSLNWFHFGGVVIIQKGWKSEFPT